MNHLQKALLDLGDTTCIREVKAISGGSINQVTYMETDKNKYIVKAHTNMPENFFIQEAMGLSALSCRVRVPKVYHYQFDESSGEASLWLEWVAAGQKCVKIEELGRKLAQLHQSGFCSLAYW